MPEGHLHAVVDAMAAAGSQQLARRAAQGAPVPFDLVEVPATGGGAPLFSYRPRTRDFVEEHVDVLRMLGQWPVAVNVLAGYDGLGDYLLLSGERHLPIDARLRADLVLRVLIAGMHEDTGDFTYTPARSQLATDKLARCLLAGRVEGTVVVPLLGVRLEGERLELEDGLALVRDDAIEGLPREARSPLANRPGTVVVVSSLEDPSQTAMMAHARPRLRNLLSALRLYDNAAPALAPVAWSRVRGDGWASNPFIGTCARASGTLHIPVAHGDAIRAFCGLMAENQPTEGSAPWALRRFELACERPNYGEALTDVLLGMRALLTTGEQPAGTLGARLAALCAVPGEWGALRTQVETAEALELTMMHGGPADPAVVRTTALELRGHLRALLRDIACGHLNGSLEVLAEQHLARAFRQDTPSAPAPQAAESGPIADDVPAGEHEVKVEDYRAKPTALPPEPAEAKSPLSAEGYSEADFHLEPSLEAADEPSLNAARGTDEPVSIDAAAAEPAAPTPELSKTGKTFEEEFIRSFVEGPSAHQPPRRKNISSQSSRPRTRSRRRLS